MGATYEPTGDTMNASAVHLVRIVELSEFATYASGEAVNSKDYTSTRRALDAACWALVAARASRLKLYAGHRMTISRIDAVGVAAKLRRMAANSAIDAAEKAFRVAFDTVCPKVAFDD